MVHKQRYKEFRKQKLIAKEMRSLLGLSGCVFRMLQNFETITEPWRRGTKNVTVHLRKVKSLLGIIQNVYIFVSGFVKPHYIMHLVMHLICLSYDISVRGSIYLVFRVFFSYYVCHLSISYMVILNYA